MSVAESAFLDGKVVRRSLPVIESPSGPGAPTLKRLLLPQGELAQFFDGEEGMRYLASIELRAGTVRGNHYHEAKEEWVYIVSGELLLLVGDIASEKRDLLPLRAGDLVIIAPRIAHALQTSASGQAIEFSKTRFDPADVYRFPLT